MILPEYEPFKLGLQLHKNGKPGKHQTEAVNKDNRNYFNGLTTPDGY